MVMTGAEWNRITSEWIGRACARRSFAGSLDRPLEEVGACREPA